MFMVVVSGGGYRAAKWVSRWEWNGEEATWASGGYLTDRPTHVIYGRLNATGDCGAAENNVCTCDTCENFFLNCRVLDLFCFEFCIYRAQTASFFFTKK